MAFSTRARAMASAAAGQAALRHCFVQDFAGVSQNLLPDLGEGCRLAAAVVFDRGADHPAGIGDEVGHNQNVLVVHDLFRLGGGGNIGPLQHQLGLERADIIFAQHVGPRGRDPDVAVDAHHVFRFERARTGKALHLAGLLLVGDEGGDIHAFGVHDGGVAVGGRHQHAAVLCEETRSMLSDGAKALHRDPCSLKPDASDLFGRLGRCHEAVAGGADLIERNAADLAWQADGAADLVIHPGHGLFVGAHVGAGDIVDEVGDGASEGADQRFLLLRRHSRIGENDRLAAAMRQACRGILQRHGARQPGAFLKAHIRLHAGTADGRAGRHIVHHNDGLETHRRAMDMQDLARAELVGEIEGRRHGLFLLRT